VSWERTLAVFDVVPCCVMIPDDAADEMLNSYYECWAWELERMVVAMLQ
jgi:hypothetical protein